MAISINNNSLGEGNSFSGEDPIADLTPREREVLDRLGRGETQKEVANAMHLSPKTIEAETQNLRQKLSARSAAELQRLIHERAQNDVAEDLEQVDRDADLAIAAIQRIKGRVSLARGRLRRPAVLTVGLSAVALVGFLGVRQWQRDQQSLRDPSAPANPPAQVEQANPFLGQPAPVAPPSEADAKPRFVASRKKDVYHAVDSPYARFIAEKNLVTFATEEEAQAAGYRPAKVPADNDPAGEEE